VLLTSTAACVLGLLQMGPAPGQRDFKAGRSMTGGQVYAAAERSVARFWNLTRSQVYAELPRLDSAGLVAPDGPPGARGAQRYMITAAGRKEFATWLAGFVRTGARPDQLRSPMLLAVFFGSFVEADQLALLLDEYRIQHERSLAIADEMLDALGDDASLPGATLARRAAFERMTLDWLAQVRALPTERRR
jgi:DNA-binding PadR family transcriptional regulator